MAVSSSLSRSISLNSFSWMKNGGCGGVVPTRRRWRRISGVASVKASESESVREWRGRGRGRRRELVAVGGMTAAVVTVGGNGNARARAEDENVKEEYEKDTRQVISQVRGTIEMEKEDPKRSSAVAALRQASNEWVAKYRREKELAGKPSFSNMYSVLNAISGHYISFGPTAPIPSKRKARILEEVDTAEKALTKGR